MCKKQALDTHPPFGIKASLLEADGRIWTKGEKQEVFSSLKQLLDTEKIHRDLQTRTQDTIAETGWTRDEKQQLLRVLGQLVEAENSNGQLIRSSKAGSAIQDSTQSAAWTVSEKDHLLDNFGQLVDTEVQLVKAVENLSSGSAEPKVVYGHPVVKDIHAESVHLHTVPLQERLVGQALRGSYP